MPSIHDIEKGDYVEKEYVIAENVGQDFAKLSGDYNPVHLDEEYASATRFKAKIAHGMLLGSYISGIIGNEFPGEGSIYISQNMNFLRPVYYNDKIRIRVEVIYIDLERKRVRLLTNCFNQNEKMVIEGEAEILLES